MKILIVASGNANKISPFITDQANVIENKGASVNYFLIKGKGILGYVKNYRKLLKAIKRFQPDLIHAHYGLSGLLATLQRKVKVVTTFHGSDVNYSTPRFFSNLAHKLGEKSIFVSHGLAQLLRVKDPVVIPCGVDLDIFYPMDQTESRKHFNLDLDTKYILFSSSFSNSVKNFKLAKESVDRLQIHDKVEILELKGYNRQEVAMLMNAADVAILTSFTEGSPQFIKEAMSCNMPIVSVDVGDVKELIGKAKECYIADADAHDISEKLKLILLSGSRSNGRELIQEYGNQIIGTELMELYHSIVN